MTAFPNQSNNDEFKFVGANDVLKAHDVDDRLIHCVPEPKPDTWHFGPGENYFFVLPSSSDYLTYFPDNVDNYQIGKPFNQITVKKVGMNRPRVYRAPKNNPLAEKFWTLYNVLYKAHGNEAEWRRITSSGFQCGGDPRRALNIIVAKPSQQGLVFSPVKIFRVPDERGSGKRAPGQLPPLYVQIVQALAQAFKMMNDPQFLARFPALQAFKPAAHLQVKYPFFPEHAALLKLTVSFRGTIPQYTSLQLATGADGAPHIVDVSQLPQLQDPRVFDMSAKWAQEFDELPDISEVEPIVTSVIASEILGVQTLVKPLASMPTAVQSVPSVMVPFAAPAAPAAVPTVPTPVPPVQVAAPVPAPQAPPVMPSAPVVAPVVAPAAAPAVAPVVAVPAVTAASNIPSAAEASALFLEKLHAELKKHQQQSGQASPPSQQGQNMPF